MLVTEYFDTRNNKRISSAVLFELSGFPRDEAALRNADIFPIVKNKPQFDRLKQKLKANEELIFDDNTQQYIETYEVVELSDTEKAILTEIENKKNKGSITLNEDVESNKQRIVDLEEAVSELGMYIDETDTISSEALLDLAGYIASLEERIATLESGKE